MSSPTYRNNGFSSTMFSTFVLEEVSYCPSISCPTWSVTLVLLSSELLNFDFNSTNICSKIIMNAECLKVAFSELDMTSDLLEILISPENPYFR